MELQPIALISGTHIRFHLDSQALRVKAKTITMFVTPGAHARMRPHILEKSSLILAPPCLNAQWP